MQDLEREFLGVIWLGKLFRAPHGYEIQQLEFEQVLSSEPKLAQALDLIGIAQQLGISRDEYRSRLKQFCLQYSQLKLGKIPIQQELIKMVKLHDSLQFQIQRLRNQVQELKLIYRLKQQQTPEPILKLESSALTLESCLIELRESISRALDLSCPRLRSLAGDLIAARLIAAAGGLDHLAKMPSSKIQILGARIRSRAKPPKHGIIYQHPSIKSAPRSSRGKLAKQLAAQIALAARSDLKGEGS